MPTELRQRNEPTRSRHYLDGAKDQTCLLNITGICTGGPAVSAHLRDEHHGRSVKASDLSTADACQECHDCLDGRTAYSLTSEEWLFYALRGLQGTMERRRQQGRLSVRLDKQTPASERPTPKRKDKAQRQAIPSRPMPNTGRPIQSRQFTKPVRQTP